MSPRVAHSFRWSDPAPVGVDLRPGKEVIGREVWKSLAFEVGDRRNPALVGEDDVREAVAQSGPPRPGRYGPEHLVVGDSRFDLIPRPACVGEEVLQGRLVHRLTLWRPWRHVSRRAASPSERLPMLFNWRRRRRF